jgi:oligo-1,6-glucosidase
MDLVVNHTSDEHAWFVESRSSRESEKRDYYIWRNAVDGHAPCNWGSSFGGSAWEWDETTGMYYLHCFSKKQPDLNWKNPKVRQEVYDIMRFWCDKGIDGFRMDVINMISKPDEFLDGPADASGYCGLEQVQHGPHTHEYLQEMNSQVLSKYDIMSVGECGGVTVEEAKQFANADGSELGMVFQFEHVCLDENEHGKWCDDPISIPALKANLTKWQEQLHEVAWNSLYFNNHDQPRVVSRLGDNSPESAKAIATALYMMQGTPYLYQGEELGMTNGAFGGIENYNDIESRGAYQTLTAAGLSKEEAMRVIAYKSRDNARTPMQWSDEPNAGFTTGTPWLKVNPNYTTINARAELADDDSVFRYYQKLIALRRESEWKEIVVYGSYELLEPDDEQVFAYVRTYERKSLLIVSNLSAGRADFTLPPGMVSRGQNAILGTKGIEKLEGQLHLDAWSAGVWVVS